jgi:bacteriorhodopsin
VIGLFAYYSLVVDRTAIHAGDRVFYLSHYLYWILTQPMLFVAVALAALPPLSNPGDRRLRASLFGGLVGAAVAWTSAGLFEAWAQSEGERWVVRPGRRRPGGGRVAALVPRAAPGPDQRR